VGIIVIAVGFRIEGVVVTLMSYPPVVGTCDTFTRKKVVAPTARLGRLCGVM
jgi:hypothetical protein